MSFPVRVNVKLPTVEVRYKNLFVDAKCEVVQGKPLPTLWNSIMSPLSVSRHFYLLIVEIYRPTSCSTSKSWVEEIIHKIKKKKFLCRHQQKELQLLIDNSTEFISWTGFYKGNPVQFSRSQDKHFKRCQRHHQTIKVSHIYVRYMATKHKIYMVRNLH